MATIDSLADEILDQIMEMLKAPTLDTWDETAPPSPGRYNALRAAALVCSRWTDRAQRALFDDIELECLQDLKFSKSPLSSGGPGQRTGSLPMQLSSLGLCTACSVQQYPTAAFTAILNASRHTLQILHLQNYRREEDMSLLCPALRESDVGAHLKSLVMEASYEVLQGYIDIFPILETLKSFSWYGYDSLAPLKTPDVENLHLRTILDAFPSPATLLHLSIGIDSFYSLDHIVAILGHPTLKLLTSLDLPFLTSSTTAEEASKVAAMAKACEDYELQWSMGGVAQ
ncbi:hypothetical protein RQP46_009719 [Phenoliferia psychrophenolica]